MKLQRPIPYACRLKVTLSVRVWIEITGVQRLRPVLMVTLSVRVWIEIGSRHDRNMSLLVTLSVRVWIEITR